ncbi:MAG: VacJ family lipoprotein [Gammaproteobacteria bacterium]|nr:VacJ family lipoprotein [Gammaproteobacteria bacterium]
MQNRFWLVNKLLVLITLLALSYGCASVKTPDQRDPLESFNRGVYQFNDVLDRNIARPVAQVYKNYVPGFVQSGVSNVFSNLDDVGVVVNDVLQLKLLQAVQDFTRLIVNSIVGIYGLFDVASELSLPKHHEDFGQTLAVWGVGDGPYLVLPFLGPSNVRDGVSLAADWKLDPVMYINDSESRWGAILLRLTDKRANLLEATKTMEKSGIDPYVFMRDAYFQYRTNLIYDGNPPREKIKNTTPEDRQLEDELDQPPQDNGTK